MRSKTEKVARSGRGWRQRITGGPEAWARPAASPSPGTRRTPRRRGGGGGGGRRGGRERRGGGGMGGRVDDVGREDLEGLRVGFLLQGAIHAHGRRPEAAHERRGQEVFLPEVPQGVRMAQVVALEPDGGDHLRREGVLGHIDPRDDSLDLPAQVVVEDELRIARREARLEAPRGVVDEVEPRKGGGQEGPPGLGGPPRGSMARSRPPSPPGGSSSAGGSSRRRGGPPSSPSRG